MWVTPHCLAQLAYWFPSCCCTERERRGEGWRERVCVRESERESHKVQKQWSNAPQLRPPQHPRTEKRKFNGSLPKACFVCNLFTLILWHPHPSPNKTLSSVSYSQLRSNFMPRPVLFWQNSWLKYYARRSFCNVAELFFSFSFPSSPPGPGPTQEELRRKVENGIKEFWYFVRSEVKKLASVEPGERQKYSDALLQDLGHQERCAVEPFLQHAWWETERKGYWGDINEEKM